jgi:hypothetical protein
MAGKHIAAGASNMALKHAASDWAPTLFNEERDDPDHV